MNEKAPHTPIITDLKMLQDILTLFSQTINTEPSPQIIAYYLKEETVELLEAVGNGYERYHLAGEAADIFIFSTEMLNILNVPLEQALAQWCARSVADIDTLQETVVLLLQHNGCMVSVKSLTEQLVSQGNKISYITGNGNDPYQLTQETIKTVAFAAGVITLLGFSLARILSQKIDRNHHKYNPFIVKQLIAQGVPLFQARTMLKAAWNSERDGEFLKG